MPKKTNEAINEMMGRVAPELTSEYAKYPLQRQAWLSPNGMGPASAPGFLADGAGAAVKIDYVYGGGCNGNGYYHLLTNESYSILASRLQSTAPIGWCCFADSRKAADEHFDVKQICYNRCISSIPDDIVAAQEAIDLSRDRANGIYQATKNQQLLVMGIMNAT